MGFADSKLFGDPVSSDGPQLDGSDRTDYAVGVGRGKVTDFAAYACALGARGPSEVCVLDPAQLVGHGQSLVHRRLTRVE